MSNDAVFVAMTAVLGVSTVLVLPAITYECASGSSSYSVLSETCRQAVQRMIGSVVFIAQIVHLPGHWTVAIVNRQDGCLFFGNTLVKSYKCPTDLPARMARIVKAWAFSFHFCIAYLLILSFYPPFFLCLSFLLRLLKHICQINLSSHGQANRLSCCQTYHIKLVLMVH